MSITQEQLARWRLILGPEADKDLSRMCAGGCGLSREQLEMDESLGAIYDDTDAGLSGARSAGRNASAPRVAKWLGDIRTYFQEDVVSVIQQDAIERKSLKQLLLEPEMLKVAQPNVQLVGTLMSLKGQIPERTKETAREVVRSVVDKIKLALEQPIRSVVRGVLNRREHSPIPSSAAIDWKSTIRRNLKNYHVGLKTIIPERVFFHSRQQRSHKWTVIVNLDQSGSMADSVVYGAICGSIFASLPALRTHVMAFDTEVVDLTEQCAGDPVDMLFGIQLGGGTDINKAVGYSEQFIEEPSKTIFLLITDLFEGGNQAQLIRRLGDLRAAGVRVMVLLALSDSGKPCYDEAVAKKLTALGIPCFACTPQLLPQLLEGALRGDNLIQVASRISAALKEKK